MPTQRVFVTGSTGYLGSRLILLLIERGHHVAGLVRPESKAKLPRGCTPIVGDPLDSTSFADHVQPMDTVVHLVGVPKPAPWKGPQFRAIDLVSTQASVAAAQKACAAHFVYVSVAHPAPVMKVYIEVRQECEALIRTSGLRATILQPWYILGPGHWWPVVLLPAYWLLEHLPPTRESALRLGLVIVRQMIGGLHWAIENPSKGIRVMDVPAIRSRGLPP